MNSKTPEPSSLDASRSLELLAVELADDLSRVESQMNAISAGWAGTTAEALSAMTGRFVTSGAELIGLLRSVATLLRQAAMSFAAQDLTAGGMLFGP